MNMTMEWKDGILIAWLDGDLDTSNREKIDGEFRQMVESKPKGVILNFSKARYVSSLGIGLIMQLHRELKGINASLRITGVQSTVRLVLDTCNLGKVIPMDQTMEHAFKMIKAAQPVAA